MRQALVLEKQWLEIHFCAVIAAGKELFHLLGRDCSWVGASAGVRYGILCEFRKFLFEFLFDDAIFLQIVGDIELLVVRPNLLAQRLDFLFQRIALNST